MRIILYLLICLFLLNENVSAMHKDQFRVLEDLSQTDPKLVRRHLKRSAGEIILGGGLLLFSSYIPINNKKDETLLTPKNAGYGLIADGTYKFASALNEEYNIFRGSRLPARQRDISMDIRNGCIDVGLACVMYLAYSYIGTPYVSTGVWTFAAGLATRGLNTLVNNVPTWVSSTQPLAIEPRKESKKKKGEKKSNQKIIRRYTLIK